MVRPGPGSRWEWGGQALPDPPLCAAAASPRATDASTPQNSSSGRYSSPAGLVSMAMTGSSSWLVMGQGWGMLWSPPQGK